MRFAAALSDAGAWGRATDAVVAPVPLAGFFCNGELGPSRAATLRHGDTSAFGIFRTREERGGER